MRQTAQIIAGAQARGWRVNTPPHPVERAGTVSIDCPHGPEVMRELIAREILVDYRPKAGIRLSPHFYNKDEECDLALAQIEEIIESRAWEVHAIAGASG
jgi:kynureninase